MQQSCAQILTFTSSLSVNASDSVYHQILSDIAKGRLKSGDRLVTTELAKRFNTSINPVREALKQLAGEGFVSFQKNSGASVATFEYAAMRNTFELLALLEPYFINEFIETVSDEKIAQLQDVLEQMQALASNEYAKYRELDTLFHGIMYQDHYNQEALSVWRKNKLLLQAFHAALPISPSRIKEAGVEHQALLSALAKGEVEQAKSLLRDHINHSENEWAMQLLKSSNRSAGRL
ncbi:GntR family transcriptional regulator [Thalassotalea sp. PLHSN55]|uniref:GntR family transcriptional regulator n=1 Tax=Thalassotalea sp. PLHSN55 TaxID=3435888 RepID=UPI003F844EC7